MNINQHNKIRIKLAELISWNELINLEKKEIIKRINEIFLERNYPWLNLDIKNKIRNSASDISYETISSLPPETFLNLLRNWYWLDFENIWLDKSSSSLKDIPVQYKESQEAMVESEFNWTIWVLVDDKWHIVINPEVKKLLKNNLWLDFDDETINNIIKYHPWDGLALFQEVYTRLIKKEEELYSWDDMKWTATKPYFIPWWVSWLTIFKDYFLDEWSLAIVPNYRWPNIDGILMNKTKIPPAVANVFDEKWNNCFDSIDENLQFSLSTWRGKVWIYFNFPSNPTWLNIWRSDLDILNWILSKYPELEINIVIDDPYWSFAINDNLDLKTPISYLIDTENNKNLTILELWSHWTKEAWVYWLRTAVMRGITHEDNKVALESKLSLAIRQTFSMSPSIPQIVMIKSILWDDINAFSSKLEISEDEIDKRINKYLDSRKEMSTNIFPRINDFKNDLISEVWEYLTPYWWNQTWINWFYLNFVLTELWKEKLIDMEKLRQICINNVKESWESNKCSFSVFEDTVTWVQCIRISLISWDTKEYSKRLKNSLEILINK